MKKVSAIFGQKVLYVQYKTAEARPRFLREAFLPSPVPSPPSTPLLACLRGIQIRALIRDVCDEASGRNPTDAAHFGAMVIAHKVGEEATCTLCLQTPPSSCTMPMLLQHKNQDFDTFCDKLAVFRSTPTTTLLRGDFVVYADIIQHGYQRTTTWFEAAGPLDVFERYLADFVATAADRPFHILEVKGEISGCDKLPRTHHTSAYVTSPAERTMVKVEAPSSPCG